MEQCLEFPGFIDVHVHFREPGATNAETTATGLAAAEKGGLSLVVTMPNTVPAGDNVGWIESNLASIGPKGTRIIPSATITKCRLGREVADLERLAEAGAAFFTDDGSYVADPKVMEEAMFRAKKLDMAICEHAMDPVELKGGVIRDCDFARKANLPIISVETETRAIERDLSICRTTGCRLHIQHISTARGVELVRMAQKEGLPVTAEATPHHLLFACEEIVCDNANFKMAPPIGNREDRAELRKAVKEGVLMFATDHAPHTAITKSMGFLKSANGIVGLETAIAVTYRAMVEDEGMPVADWAKAWYEMPKSIIHGNIDALRPTRIFIGETRRVGWDTFAGLSRNSPYFGLDFDCWPID